MQEPRYECKLRKRGEGKGEGGAEERVCEVRGSEDRGVRAGEGCRVIAN